MSSIRKIEGGVRYVREDMRKVREGGKEERGGGREGGSRVENNKEWKEEKVDR